MEYSALKQLAKVKAGLKGGSQFGKPASMGKLTIARPPELVATDARYGGAKVARSTPIDVYMNRKGK